MKPAKALGAVATVLTLTLNPTDAYKFNMQKFKNKQEWIELQDDVTMKFIKQTGSRTGVRSLHASTNKIGVNLVQRDEFEVECPDKPTGDVLKFVEHIRSCVGAAPVGASGKIEIYIQLNKEQNQIIQVVERSWQYRDVVAEINTVGYDKGKKFYMVKENGDVVGIDGGGRSEVLEILARLQ